MLGKGPNNAGIDDLSFSGPEPVAMKLILGFLNDHERAVGLDQTLTKNPECVAIRYASGFVQPGKALKAHMVENLVFNLFIRLVKKLLEHQQANQQFCGIRRPAVLDPAGPGYTAIYDGSNGRVTDLRVQYYEWVTLLVELGFTFLVGRQNEHGGRPGWVRTSGL